MRRANVSMMCPFLDVRKRIGSQVLFRETWKSQYTTVNRVNEQIRRYRVHLDIPKGISIAFKAELCGPSHVEIYVGRTPIFPSNVSHFVRLRAHPGMLTQRLTKCVPRVDFWIQEASGERTAVILMTTTADVFFA